MTGEILEKMASNEYLISELYITFAKQGSDLSGFWAHLSKEEVHHQSMILLFSEKVKAGEVGFEESRFKIKSVELVREYLIEKINQAKNKPLSEIEALVVAVDIEESLLEKKIFTIFETDSIELRKLLDLLRIETETHLKEVKKKLESVSRTPSAIS